MRPLRHLMTLAVLSAACTTAAVPPGPSASATGTTAPVAAGGVAPLAADRIQILHTNDIHGHLDSVKVTSGARTFDQGGMAVLAGMIERQRARAPARTLVLDAGDAFVGTLISALDHGKSVIKAMSLAGYDAMALGNHDFDWGQDELSSRAAEASFPLLAANVVEEATARSPPFAKPYVIEDLGIAKIGIIGLTYPSGSIIKAASVKGLAFLPAVDSVRKYLPEVRRQADVIVVLSHLGLEGGSARIGGGDTALALAVPDIDVIVGGHDHQAFRLPRVVGKTRILQTGSYTDNLGRAELTIDPATKKVTALEGSLLPVGTGAAPAATAVASLVSERRIEADKYGKRVLGRATGLLAADRDMNAPLGNLVADALLDHGRRQGWKSDVAFYNGAGIRASIPAGDITYYQLAEVLPFQNSVVNVDLTGDQLKEVLEGMAGSAGRLFMSGGTMAYRFANADGKRVLRATIGGQPLDTARTYHVVTIDYLLGGGDGHAVFTRGSAVVYGDVDVDVAADYVAAHSPISPTSPGRVTQE